MRYDPDHKARTREKVLDEAAALVREAGPHGLGIGAVMARAGLTHGGFYAHFASRDELLAETVGHMVSRRGMSLVTGLADAADAAAESSAAQDPRRALRRYVRGYLSWAHAAGPAGGCPLPLLASEASYLPEAARARYAEAFERLVGALEGNLARTGMAAPRVAALAPAVAVEMIGAVAVARALPDRTRAEALLARVRDSVIEKLGLAPAAIPAPTPAG